MVVNAKLHVTMLLRSNIQCHMALDTIINQDMLLGSWYIIKYYQARSNAEYLSGGCQVSSLVMRGRLDFLYLCVLHVTGFRTAVGFHLVLVSLQLGLENQFLYLSLGKDFLLKLVIASNLLAFKLLMLANFNALLNDKYCS